MASFTSAERDLVLALNGDLHGAEAGQAFVELLRQSTSATGALLEVRFAPGTPRETHVVRAGAPPALTLAATETLRPNRVYALRELTDDPASLAPVSGGATGTFADVADARVMRVNARGGHLAVLAVTAARSPFDARDSALLSSVGPHLVLALDAMARFAGERWRARMAEEALAGLGIGQVALDTQGRVVLADGHSEEVLGARPGMRLPFGPAAVRAISSIAAGDWAERDLATLETPAAEQLLLRPGPGDADYRVAAVAAFRSPQDQARALPARLLARLLGLSEREAALADALARGKSILEAGQALRLTPETARNYTKRAYAKTGVRGQADLVRLVLTGLAPLA